METNTVSQNEGPITLDEINDLSEEAIKADYLAAALHGPRWILGLIDETV